MRQRIVLLIAPDSQDVCLTQQTLARASPHPIVQVICDDEEALASLLREGVSAAPRRAPSPDVIFLDLPLPRLRGPEVVWRLKHAPRFHCVPIIVLAPAGRAEEVSQVYAAGANAYVQKPVEMTRFLDLIGQLGHFWLETVTLPPLC